MVVEAAAGSVVLPHRRWNIAAVAVVVIAQYHRGGGIIAGAAAWQHSGGGIVASVAVETMVPQDQEQHIVGCSIIIEYVYS